MTAASPDSYPEDMDREAEDYSSSSSSSSNVEHSNNHQHEQRGGSLSEIDDSYGEDNTSFTHDEDMGEATFHMMKQQTQNENDTKRSMPPLIMGTMINAAQDPRMSSVRSAQSQAQEARVVVGTTNPPAAVTTASTSVPVTPNSSNNNHGRAAALRQMILMQQQQQQQKPVTVKEDAAVIESDDGSSSFDSEESFSEEESATEEVEQEPLQTNGAAAMMRMMMMPQQQQQDAPAATANNNRAAAMMKMRMMQQEQQAAAAPPPDAKTPVLTPSSVDVATAAPSSTNSRAAMMQRMMMQQQHVEQEDDESSSGEEDSTKEDDDSGSFNSSSSSSSEYSIVADEISTSISQQRQVVHEIMAMQQQQHAPPSVNTIIDMHPKCQSKPSVVSPHKVEDLMHEEEVEPDAESSEEEEEDFSSSGYSDLMADLPVVAQRKAVPRVKKASPSPAAVQAQEMDEDASQGGFSVEGGEAYDEGSSSEEDESDDDSSYDEDDMDTRDSGSYDSSEDFSSSAGSGYSDIMKEMVRGRQPGDPASGGSTRFNASFRETGPVTPSKGLPVMKAPGLPVTTSSNDIPCEDPPLEGLAMLKNIRSELEKVGQLIVKNKDGEKFLQRAQILTSINYLASNVPKCVVEDLGREIRDQLKAQEEKKNRKANSRNVMASLVSIPDDGSEFSELSRLDVDECSDSDMMEDDDFFPEEKLPGSQRRKSFTLENFVSKTGRQALGIGISAHSSGHVLEPKLREENCPVRKKATRTYSFASTSSNSETTEWDEPNLPIVTYFEGALLFVDISGFTKLSTLLDPENLSKVINTYFEVRQLKAFSF